MFTTQEMQRSFDQKNVEMLQEAMGRLHPEVCLLSRFGLKLVTSCKYKTDLWKSNLPPTCLCSSLLLQEGKYYLKMCIDSGLWVPEADEGDDEEKDEDEEEEDGQENY